MKILLKTLLLFGLFFGLSGCEDNNYDGKTGLNGSGSSSDLNVPIENIYTNIMQQDADTVYSQSQLLITAVETLQNGPTEQNLTAAQNSFKKLARYYKRVESAYVAGYNSDDMRDLADFYIEHYIKGSKAQDIPGDLDKVFAGNGTLVKNSSKGITAMEYTLFGHQEELTALTAKLNTDRLASAVTIANTIATNLKKIKLYYQSDTLFLEDNDAAISALLNVLVDNSYKLKEIRIGDAAGYTIKYKDDPDSTRLEYYKSLNSLDAIEDILLTHKRLMSTGLNDIAEAGNAVPEAEAIVTVIDEALAICDSYKTPLEDDLVSLETKSLYRAANTLQNNYTALINALNFTQDIIEADGD